jgi:hypothetical protein
MTTLRLSLPVTRRISRISSTPTQPDSEETASLDSETWALVSMMSSKLSFHRYVFLMK